MNFNWTPETFSVTISYRSCIGPYRIVVVFDRTVLCSSCIWPYFTGENKMPPSDRVVLRAIGVCIPVWWYSRCGSGWCISFSSCYLLSAEMFSAVNEDIDKLDSLIPCSCYATVRPWLRWISHHCLREVSLRCCGSGNRAYRSSTAIVGCCSCIDPTVWWC